LSKVTFEFVDEVVLPLDIVVVVVVFVVLVEPFLVAARTSSST